MLTWPSIMFPSAYMLWFFDRRHKSRIIKCFEFSGCQKECFESQIGCTGIPILLLEWVLQSRQSEFKTLPLIELSPLDHQEERLKHQNWRRMLLLCRNWRICVIAIFRWYADYLWMISTFYSNIVSIYVTTQVLIIAPQPNPSQVCL